VEKITLMVEAENSEKLNSLLTEARRMLRKIRRKSDEKIGYVIIAINKETGTSRKIISQSQA
jgi:hypothetical protein